jgi:hypothetical protein
MSYQGEHYGAHMGGRFAAADPSDSESASYGSSEDGATGGRRRKGKAISRVMKLWNEYVHAVKKRHSIGTLGGAMRVASKNWNSCAKPHLMKGKSASAVAQTCSKSRSVSRGGKKTSHRRRSGSRSRSAAAKRKARRASGSRSRSAAAKRKARRASGSRSRSAAAKKRAARGASRSASAHRRRRGASRSRSAAAQKKKAAQKAGRSRSRSRSAHKRRARK